MPENNQTIPFNAWVNFNDQIFAELDSKIRPLLNLETSDLNQELQIRTLLYTNFNNYLTLLLSKIEEDLALTFLQNFQAAPEDKRLELVGKTINKPIDIIVNNFVELFKRKIK